MTWDESAVVAADRAEAALNPERRTTLAVRAEESFEDPSPGPACPAATRAGRWHMPHSGPCLPDPWETALEVAS